MTDTPEEPAKDAQTPEPTELPEIFTIPDRSVERWIGLPGDKPLALALRRDDIDHLFFGIRDLAQAVAGLDQVLVNFSNGDTDEANRLLVVMRTHLRQSLNHNAMLMAAIMDGAQPIEPPNG